MDNNPPQQSHSPDEIVTLGKQIYFENKDKLESEHAGEFAVIEVDSRDITINADKLAAIEEAKRKFPDKLFFIVEIGTLKEQSVVNELKGHAWPF